MRITTRAVYDIATLQLLHCDSFEYSGPVALCKKGRESQAANTEFEQGLAKTDAAQQARETGAADKNLASYDSLQPNHLTDAASAALAADTANIDRTYNGMRQTAFAQQAARGFGAAPSGIGATQQNALNVGQEGSDTGAFRNAEVNTQRQKDFATQEHAALAGQGAAGEVANTGAATNSAFDQSKMGSTAGDIAGGIAEAAPIIAAPFTGGASLFPQLAQNTAQGGLFKNIGTYGGGGGSAPSYGYGKT